MRLIEQASENLSQTDVTSRPSNGSPIGIYNETDQLRYTTTWGPVGAEAVLAQLLPKQDSLFHSEMDVQVARQEGLNYSSYLTSHGVQVVHARDMLAHLLPLDNLDRNTVLHDLAQKAKTIQNQYGLDPRFNGKAAIDVVMDLLEEDITLYGEGAALALNHKLSIEPQIPMGNTMFTRDQMNVILDTRVVSRMAMPIRMPEVGLYEQVYSQLLNDHKKIEIPEGEVFEGGDAYVHNGNIYVGVGARTSRKAALHIYQSLRPLIDESGLRFVMVEDPLVHSRSLKEQMDYMHLDTFSNPIGEKQIAVCVDEAKKRIVHFVDTDDNGNVFFYDRGQSFLEHLVETGNEVVEVTAEEQENFGCNFLTLNADTIIFPEPKNDSTIKKLEGMGKQVVVVDLYQSTRGYGAAHCMTGQLARK